MRKLGSSQEHPQTRGARPQITYETICSAFRKGNDKSDVNTHVKVDLVRILP